MSVGNEVIHNICDASVYANSKRARMAGFKKLLAKASHWQVFIITDAKSQGNFLPQIFKGRKLKPLIVIIRDYHHPNRLEYAENLLKLVKDNNPKHKVLIAGCTTIYRKLLYHNLPIYKPDGIHLRESQTKHICNIAKKYKTRLISIACHSEKSFTFMDKFAIKPNFCMISPVFKTKSHLDKKPLNKCIFAKIATRYHNRNIIALGGINNSNINKLKLLRKNLRGIAGIRF